MVKFLYPPESWYPPSPPPPRQAGSHAQLNVERVWLALIANHNTSEQQTVIPKMPERLQYIHNPKCGTSLLTVLQNPLDACVTKNFLCIKHRTLTHLVPLQVEMDNDTKGSPSMWAQLDDCQSSILASGCSPDSGDFHMYFANAIKKYPTHDNAA